MRKLYSGEPTGDNKVAERLAWRPIEEYEIGKRTIIIFILSILAGIFIFHLGWLALVPTIVICVVGVLVMKDAHNKAFDRYWDYWSNHQK